MSLRPLLLAAVLALVPLAVAQGDPVPELQPVPAGSLPATPVLLDRAATPSPAGTTATLDAPRMARSPLTLSMTVQRPGGPVLVVAVRRDNAQNCAFAPLLRVVEVGTRRVVYPVAGRQRLCTQEIVTKSTAATGRLSFSREVTLPPGEYVIEAWLPGVVEGALVRVPAAPVRVSVK
ncbi:hypothetical protein HNQ07_000646 [Deinococcus metalli]|uniref:Intracellular proteinase inhibitor BsuPI domain-containing protein n=1 Tax=Deinococcus metalli TaxID=1141878 RepID=A0A7W8NQJ7_9DEIO|nr:hypothetical protein [Deinococcus metalli]MBB5375202.1 hypothetical protein [Deinococcus metalli]GHF31006.1 hypothetical protein GCM10017781_03950 [Deinococcus metalli]